MDRPLGYNLRSEKIIYQLLTEYNGLFLKKNKQEWMGDEDLELPVVLKKDWI